MPTTTFVINGRKIEVDAEVDTPLLWINREQLKLTGTKFGCGIAQCGACTVHVEGNAVRSCQVSLEDVAEKNVTTIEGLSANADHPLQIAWIAEQVPQCGYCQSGQIMQAAASSQSESPANAPADYRWHGRQYLPLWDVSADCPGHRARDERRITMPVDSDTACPPQAYPLSRRSLSL